jgi:hypothetical protein
MREHLDAYKPAAAARTHLFLAALLWTIVGAVLVLLGGHWTWSAGVPYRGAWLTLAALAGGLKARFVLLRTAQRIVDRIRRRGDGRCIGGFVSWRTWAFIALMMVLGYVLRHGLLPHGVVGVIYVAVGVALLIAATRVWRAWYHYANDDGARV